MPHIVLTEEQEKIIAQAEEPVEVRDGQGRVLTQIVRLSAVDLEVLELHRRRKGQPQEPGIPAERVHALLRKLEEVAKTEGIDRDKVKEFVRRSVAGEPL